MSLGSGLGWVGVRVRVRVRSPPGLPAIPWPMRPEWPRWACCSCAVAPAALSMPSWEAECDRECNAWLGMG